MVSRRLVSDATAAFIFSICAPETQATPSLVWLGATPLARHPAKARMYLENLKFLRNVLINESSKQE
jgi:hypothetical protein